MCRGQEEIPCLGTVHAQFNFQRHIYSPLIATCGHNRPHLLLPHQMYTLRCCPTARPIWQSWRCRVMYVSENSRVPETGQPPSSSSCSLFKDRAGKHERHTHTWKTPQALTSKSFPHHQIRAAFIVFFVRRALSSSSQPQIEEAGLLLLGWWVLLTEHRARGAQLHGNMFSFGSTIGGCVRAAYNSL